MVRVKRGVVSHRRHKVILDNVKGYYSSRSRNFKVAKQAFIKSGQYAYSHRRLKKRSYRRLWIVKINAFLKQHNILYSRFINLLNKSNIIINRKILADFAVNNQYEFNKILSLIKIC